MPAQPVSDPFIQARQYKYTTLRTIVSSTKSSPFNAPFLLNFVSRQYVIISVENLYIRSRCRRPIRSYSVGYDRADRSAPAALVVSIAHLFPHSESAVIRVNPFAPAGLLATDVHLFTRILVETIRIYYITTT